jgi:hypothetical protein
MTRNLPTLIGTVLLATTLHAQQPTPATQPVRPPDRPPAGEPSPPTLPLPAPERGGGDDDERPLTGRSTPEAGDPEQSTVVLKGCLERVDAKAFRLRGTRGNDATVTEDVRLEGAVDLLRANVGKLVEVRGTYEQGTPATTDPFFSVTRVKPLAGECSTK